MIVNKLKKILTMKKIILCICLAGFVFTAAWAQLDRSKAPQPGKAPKIQLGKYESFLLANGLKVIVVENRKIPRVAFSLNLDVDPVLEKDKAGMVELTGQLLRRGTATRSKDKLDEEVDFIGAELFTFSTGAFASGLKKHSDQILTLMSDVVLNPSFPQDELDKLKKETVSGLKANKDDANAIAANLQRTLRFGKSHPFGENQTEKTIENITLEDCKKHYQTYFRPNVSYLVVVGDITAKEAKTLTEKYFAKWQKADVPKNKYDLPQVPKQSEVAISDKAGAVQTVLSITYPINLKLGDPDYIKALLLNQILGGGGGARLYNNLRESKGFTYGAYSNMNQSRFVGFFNAYASVRTEVTDSSVVQFLYELERIRNEKVNPEELQRYKNVMTGNFARSIENPQTVANFALNTALYNLPKDYYETYLEKINAVTLEDIQTVAQKFILPKNAHIIAVGDQKAIEGKLKGFGKVSRYDNYGNVATGADQSLLQGMTAEKVIDKYLTAIGGKASLEKVKSLKMDAEIEFQGQKIISITLKKTPNLFSQVQKLPPAFGGMEMKTIYDGKRGVAAGMQGSQEVTGDDLKEMDLQARLFIELEYSKLGIKAELGDVKMVNDQPTFEVTFTAPNGRKLVKNYAVDSGLALKQMQMSTQQGGILKDYKEVQGVKFPHTILVNSQMGELPVKFTSIEINPALDDSVFKIQ